MSNTNNLNIVLQPPPIYLVGKAKTMMEQSVWSEDYNGIDRLGRSKQYMEELNELRDLPSLDDYPRTPGISTIISKPFYNYKDRPEYKQELTKYGIYFTWASGSNSPPFDWNPRLRPSNYASEYASRSARALGIFNQYVLTKNDFSHSPKVIGLKYSAKVSFTNITQQNKLYSHYLRDDFGKYTYKIDSFPNIPSFCLYNLPENEINNSSNTTENILEFEVEIFFQYIYKI